MSYRSLLLAALAGIPAFSASLSVPSQVAGPGQVVLTSIGFSAEGQAIAGLQFDLEWDPSLDLKLVIGDNLRQSSKTLFTAQPGPRSVRCLIVGLNLDVLSDGPLLNIFLVVDGQAAPGRAQVRVANPLATDPLGGAVTLAGLVANVQIGSAPSIPVALSSTGVLNAASLMPGPVSPGEIVTLLGALPSTPPMLLFNGIRAHVLYAGLNQVNAIVPFGLAIDAPANLEVRTEAGSATLPLEVAPVAPALFTPNSTGSGPGAVLNQDYTLNSPSNPAPRGSIIMLYGTGFGSLDPQPADGQIADGAASTRLPVTASIAGVPALVSYAGAAPGLIAGVVQVNVRVPDDAAPSLAARVFLSIGAATTPGVTVAIQ